MILAEALSRKHGEVHVARESSGLHLYMASPQILEEEGSVELRKRHLAVNVDRYLKLGQWRKRNYDNDWSAMCMKSGKAYRISDLVSMLPLNQRGVLDAPLMQIKVHNTKRSLVPDGKGNMIPVGPGECIPLPELPHNHVAREYVERRGYDVNILWRQFRASYCVKETPEDRDQAVYYKRLAMGFNDTPQGRIIFFGDIKGVQQIWQARVIDRVEGGLKFYWHPYENIWVACEARNPETGKFTPLPEVASSRFEWGPAKYKTATGASRNTSLIGFDASVNWNKMMGIKSPIIFLAEGPLDAGRWGPPACGMMGKHLSKMQAMLISDHFKRLIYIPDTGKAGQDATKSVIEAMGPNMYVKIAALAAGRSDPGEMTNDEAWAIVKPYL